MGAKSRQFFALTRKNYINWKRQPGCSFCEICCPAAVMFFLVWIRTLVDPVTYNSSSLEMLKVPLFPGLYYEGNNEWSSSVVNVDKISKEITDFMVYDNYTFVDEND